MVCTYLKKSCRDAQRYTSAPKRPLVVRDRPRVPSKVLEDARQLELALLDRHQEPRCTKRLLGQRLSWTGSSAVLGRETEHVLNLLLGVVFVAAEDVGLAAFGVPDLVDLSL